MAYLVDQAKSSLKQIFGSFPPVSFPEKGSSPEETLTELRLRHSMDPDLHGLKFFALMYPTGSPEHEQVLEESNKLYFWGNALNILKFPQILRLESEVISMVSDLIHAPDGAGGTITSGGTESILMSMLVNRERAIARGIEKPQILAPYSAHPAYAKAAKLFCMEYITFPYDSDYRANVDEARKLISPRTAVVVASAMSFPHGTMDPIEELAALAAEHGVGCHVDACLAGFVLPFMEKLGYELDPWDFRVPGVTEISTDLHKYGYSSKGSSIILHRDEDWMDHQFFLFDGWPSGLYGTPGIAGARPTTPIATSWAVLRHLGLEGYLRLTKEAMEAAENVLKGIEELRDVYVIGRPVGPVLAFGSDTLDINRVGDMLTAKGWHFDRNLEPPSLHVMFSPAHRQVADEFLADLAQVLEQVRESS